MKITKSQLKQIIQEELETSLKKAKPGRLTEVNLTDKKNKLYQKKMDIAIRALKDALALWDARTENIMFLNDRGEDTGADRPKVELTKREQIYTELVNASNALEDLYKKYPSTDTPYEILSLDRDEEERGSEVRQPRRGIEK